MPNSQLITPPDIVESVLIINADPVQRNAVVKAVAINPESYNIYLYQEESKEFQWLDDVCRRVQTILLNNERHVVTSGNGRIIRFGPEQEIKNPAEYFNK